MRALLLILLALPWSAAVESEERAAAKALYAEAAKRLDVWTMIQLDAWSDRTGARMRSGLTGIEVIGDPLFALPARHEQLFHVNGRVIATARNRIYQWAPDGRPVQVSWPLPCWPNEGDVDPTTRAFGLIDRQEHADDVHATHVVAAINLADGSVPTRAAVPGTTADRPRSVRVADDASAVVAALIGPAMRLIVVTGETPRVIAGWRDPQAIGRRGAWLIAVNPEGKLTLATATKQTPIRASATGPGATVVLADDQLFQVAEDGALVPLNLPIGVGKEAELESLGGWLIVGSGPGATSKPSLDVLGNPVGGGAPQPDSCALYRWADLQAEPRIEVMPLRVAENQEAALYRWSETALELMDLSGDEPQTRPHATAPAPITWIHDQFQITRVGLKDGRTWLIDVHGREVAAPMAERLDVQSRDWALARGGTADQPVFSAVRLAVDPAARSITPLPLEPAPWSVVIPINTSLATAWNDLGQWRRIDARTGAVVAQGDVTNRRGVDHTWDPRGGFYARGARILRKADDQADAGWMAIDAWRQGRTTLVLSQNGTVWASSKRGGEWNDLGDVPGGYRFGRSGDQLAVLARDGSALRIITPQGRLDAAPNQPATGMQPGPWQVRGDQFVPPRSGNLVWNHDTGLDPEVLRCPDNDSLLVPVGAIVLAIDPAGAKLVGKPR